MDPRVSDKRINIDGSEHGPECAEPGRGSFCRNRQHVHCGVYMHFQALHGGQVWVCPECGAEE